MPGEKDCPCSMAASRKWHSHVILLPKQDSEKCKWEHKGRLVPGLLSTSCVTMFRWYNSPLSALSCPVIKMTHGTLPLLQYWFGKLAWNLKQETFVCRKCSFMNEEYEHSIFTLKTPYYIWEQEIRNIHRGFQVTPEPSDVLARKTLQQADIYQNWHYPFFGALLSQPPHLSPSSGNPLC